MSIQVIFLLLFLMCTVVISYQDFKERMISVWVVLLFWLVSISAVLVLQNSTALWRQLLNSLIYCLFCFLVIALYYFVREKRWVKIIDTKLGFGDIFILPALGITFDLAGLIVFFAAGFIISSAISLFFVYRGKTVPLAGLMISWHFIFLNLKEEIFAIIL